MYQNMPGRIEPTKIYGFNVYNEGKKLIGVQGDVELPNLTPITNEVSGAGIAGVIDDPNPGLFESMEFGLNFRGVNDDISDLCIPKAHMLSLYADQRGTRTSSGEYDDKQIRITIRGYVKGFETGKIKPGEGTDTSVKFELDYFKLEVDGVTKFEVDKFNYIYVVNGVDYLEQVRRNI